MGLLAAAGLLPLLAVFGQTFIADGQFSLELYRDVLFSAHQRMLLGRSFTVAASTGIAATLIGLPLGLLFARTDLPLRLWFAALFTVSLLVPPYITAISWFHLVGRGGWVAAWFGAGVAETTSRWLFGFPGTVLVLTSAFLPIVMLLTMAFARTVDPRLEEAARLVTGERHVLARVTLPLIAPGVLLGSVLVFLLSLAEFGVPMFLRYDVYSVESFTRFAAFYDARAATAAALPLALIAILVLGFERLFLRERTYRLQPVTGGKDALTWHLGRLRGPLFVLVGAVALLLVALPLLVLLVKSGSLATYAEAFTLAGDALLRSLVFAGVGATALTVIGFFLGYLIQQRALPLWRSVDTLTVLLFALPSTVIAIGLVSVWNRPATAFLYGTPAIIVLGYVAKYAALASRTTVSALGLIPPSMDEAARIAGAGWFRRIGQIVAPLAGRGLAVAWLLSFLFCLRDLGITMMVYPPGSDTLPVRTFTLMANGPPPLIAALSVIMVAVTLVPLGAAGLLMRTR